ncbi:MAG: MATE family efflux transporter [Oliverpabstia sp.]
MLENKRNKTKQIDFTSGAILQPIILFSLPVLMGNLFSALYNVVDSVVVGKFVGSYALAAVNASFAITMMCTAVYAGFGMGCAVLIGQLYGAKKKEDLNRAAATSLMGAVIVGLTMSVIGLTLSRPILILINTPADIIGQADVYLKIALCGCASQLLYFMGSGLIRALGDSKTPMYFLVFCAVTNIILDLVFVLFFDLKCAGVALATLISQFLSAILVVRQILTGNYGIHMTRKDWRIDREMLGRILYVGIPRAVQQLADSLGLIIIQSFANSFGTNFVAVNGIIQKLDTFALLPIRAVGETVTMYNAQNLGAGKYGRIKDGNRKSMALVFFVGLSIGIFFFFGTDLVFRLFLSVKDPGYVDIVRMGKVSIRILAFFYSVYGVQQILSSIMAGIGDTRPVMAVGVVCIVVRVVLTYFSAMVTRKYQNLYWSTCAYHTMFMMGTLLFYKLGTWKKGAVSKVGRN